MAEDKYQPFPFWLLQACENNDMDYLRARLDGKEIDLNRNFEYACGATFVLKLPLIIAFEHGYLELARFLISKGASPDAFCRKTQKTPRNIMPKGFIR